MTKYIACSIIFFAIITLGPSVVSGQQESNFTVHIDSGLSIRNHEKGHYYPMMKWDETPYKEFAWWDETDKGSIIHFMNFRVVFPPNFVRSTDKRYPAIVMLHGTSGSGRKDDDYFDYHPSDTRYDNNSKQLHNGGQEHLKAVNTAEAQGGFTGIVIVPQASYNGGWGDANIHMIARFLEWMIENYQVDQYRIAVHGLSNGAKGAWKLATDRPDLITAALPMSGTGNGDIDSIANVLVTTAMWIFQGELDTNPSASYAQRWYEGLVSKGGTPKYTVYKNTRHTTWPLAYAEPDFFAWIRAQNKRRIHIMGGDPRENPCEEPVTETLRLGFSAGFLDYQWMRDGEEIPGANDRFLTAAEEGIYSIKFKRRTDSTWDESFSLDVYYNDPNLPEYKPSLKADGYTTLPYYGLDRTLKLIADRKFTSYNWFKDGEPIAGFDGDELLLNNVEGTLFTPEDAGVYTVMAFDQYGCTSAVSDPLTVTWDSTLVIDNKKPLVYPNPFYDEVHVKFPDRTFLEKDLALYDHGGRMILQEKITNQVMTLDLSRLPAGVYILLAGKSRMRVIKAARGYSGG